MSDHQPVHAADQGRLVLHVGFHKTGTSAIQESLHSASVKLHAQGVIYPEPSNEVPSHLDLAAALGFADHLGVRLEADPVELVDRYAALCHDVGPEQAVVISSEEFCSANYNVESFKRLEAFVTSLPLTPTIVAMTRPPIDFVVSLYHHYVRSRGDLCFRTWIESRPWHNASVPWFAFEKRMQIWHDHFHDVRVADFSDLTEQGASVINGFLQTAGLDCEVDRPNLRANIGIHPYLADAVRGVRASGMQESEVQQTVAQLLRIGSRLPKVDAAEYYLGAEGKAALIAALDDEVQAAAVRTRVPA